VSGLGGTTELEQLEVELRLWLLLAGLESLRGDEELRMESARGRWTEGMRHENKKILTSGTH
jgi:hypothetical protein